MIKRIHQILPSYSPRDAVGTDTYLIREYLRSRGVESEIYYEISGSDDSLPLEALRSRYNDTDTALLFHFSIGSDFPGHFAKLQNRKIVRYHNITPEEFFCAPAEGHIRQACSRGRQQIPMLSVFADLVIGDSSYNGREFSRYSKIPVEVVPIFRDYQQLVTLANSKETEQALGRANKPVLLFVGRICPNKAQHDLMKMVALYKETFQAPLGLVLVGGFFSEAFRAEIENYARYLKLSITDDLRAIAHHDIVVAGSISDEQMASLYKHSTAFCSLSDHEGFGVPLVEAMNFGLPIVAHAAAAVPETLGDAGLLVDKNNWKSLLESLHGLLNDPDWRSALAERATRRADELSLRAARSTLGRVLQAHSVLA